MSLEFRLSARSFPLKTLPMSVKDNWPFSSDGKRPEHAWKGRGERRGLAAFQPEDGMTK